MISSPDDVTIFLSLIFTISPIVHLGGNSNHYFLLSTPLQQALLLIQNLRKLLIHSCSSLLSVAPSPADLRPPTRNPSPPPDLALLWAVNDARISRKLFTSLRTFQNIKKPYQSNVLLLPLIQVTYLGFEGQYEGQGIPVCRLQQQKEQQQRRSANFAQLRHVIIPSARTNRFFTATILHSSALFVHFWLNISGYYIVVPKLKSEENYYHN